MACVNNFLRQKRSCRRGLALLACTALLTVSGCAVGPDFKAPQPEVPATWTGPPPAAPESAASVEQQLAAWWTVFDDPLLTSLEERAVQSNLDLLQAESRIRQARAARGIAFSAIGPTADATGSYDRSRTPVTTNGNTTGVKTSLYQAGFDAGWEIDIFGGVRRNIEAADADLQSAVETRRDVLVTLTAEVASNFINLRAFQQRLEIARRNLEAQQHFADLTRQRFEAGLVSELDTASADAQVATTAAQIPVLESSVRQTIYSLSVLLGAEPAALLEELDSTEVIPAAPPEVPVGVPSELLRRRPDIRRAESDIHAATARIGVATADLFPRFTISGAIGLRDSNFGSMFEWAKRFWSFGPSVSWNLFETGRTLSNIELQKALQEENVLVYRQTVLTALQEVENALIASTKEQDRRKALADSVTANRKAVDLATKLYTAGQTDFLSVLDAERSLYAAEDALTQSTGTVSTNLVALYKALGGGWQSENTEDGGTP